MHVQTECLLNCIKMVVNFCLQFYCFLSNLIKFFEVIFRWIVFISHRSWWMKLKFSVWIIAFALVHSIIIKFFFRSIWVCLSAKMEKFFIACVIWNGIHCKHYHCYANISCYHGWYLLDLNKKKPLVFFCRAPKNTKKLYLFFGWSSWNAIW